MAGSASVAPRPDLLVLARHALPDDMDAAARMGERLRALDVDLVVTSTMQRAIDTGRAVADVLGVVYQTADGLQEHARDTVGWLSDEVFEASVRGLLQRPDEPVFGEETGAQAERRFSAAVDALVKAHRDLRLVIVSHGTVMALHLAARYGLDAWRTWQRFGCPCYVVVDRSTKTVVDFVDRV
jgi:broad specificity phosphatase PhoE